jgi:predicted secreted protein
MATFNGTSLTLTIGGVDVAQSTSCSITLDADTIDVSSKDSSGYQVVIQGQKSGTVDFEGLVDLAGNTTGGAIYTYWSAGTEVAWVFSDGTKSISGNGIVTNLSIDAPMEDVATYSGSLQITGSVTLA